MSNPPLPAVVENIPLEHVEHANRVVEPPNVGLLLQSSERALAENYQAIANLGRDATATPVDPQAPGTMPPKHDKAHNAAAGVGSHNEKVRKAEAQLSPEKTAQVPPNVADDKDKKKGQGQSQAAERLNSANAVIEYLRGANCVLSADHLDFIKDKCRHDRAVTGEIWKQRMMGLDFALARNAFSVIDDHSKRLDMMTAKMETQVKSMSAIPRSFEKASASITDIENQVKAAVETGMKEFFARNVHDIFQKELSHFSAKMENARPSQGSSGPQMSMIDGWVAIANGITGLSFTPFLSNPAFTDAVQKDIVLGLKYLQDAATLRKIHAAFSKKVSSQ